MELDKLSEKLQREERTSKLLNSTIGQLQDEVELEAHTIDEIIMNLDESWEDYKKKYEDSREIVYPGVEPIGQSILTTATLLNILEQKKYLTSQKFDINMIDTLKKSVSDVQTVVAVGPACQQVKVGDLIKIRMEDFYRVVNPNSVNSQEVFELPLEDIGSKQYVEMHERNLKYIYKQEKK
jgi:hypothetical protein